MGRVYQFETFLSSGPHPPQDVLWSTGVLIGNLPQPGSPHELLTS